MVWWVQFVIIQDELDLLNFKLNKWEYFIPWKLWVAVAK